MSRIGVASSAMPGHSPIASSSRREVKEMAEARPSKRSSSAAAAFRPRPRRWTGRPRQGAGERAADEAAADDDDVGAELRGLEMAARRWS